jgi:hypothetical protein
MPAPTLEQFTEIIDKLMKDTANSVHELYRGQLRGETARARTEVGRQAAVTAIAELLGHPISRPSGSAEVKANPGILTQKELESVRRCIMAWVPMGPPNTAAPESRCVAGGREMIPIWGEREAARTSLAKLG